MPGPHLLDALRISSPCEASDEQLETTERTGQLFCVACRETVHDLSARTREEAWALVARRQAGERLCISLTVRDEDGAVRLADGYARPAPRSGQKKPRALPLLMPALVAAGASALVACTENAPHAATLEPPHVGLATSPSTQPTPSAPPPAVSPTPDPPEGASGQSAPDGGAAQACPPGKAPPKGPSLPGHSVKKGGMG
jgi:hypothetical protein